MSTVAIIIDNVERFLFFKRFTRALKELSVVPVFITLNLSIAILCKVHGIKCVSPSLIRSPRVHAALTQGIYNSRQYLEGVFTEQDLLKTSKIAIDCWERLLEYKPEQIWIWNGTDCFSRALHEAAKTSDAKFLFFEIPNIPQKIFVDPCGVNYESSLANNKDQVLNHPFTEDHNRWISDYISQKHQQHIVPQARKPRRPIAHAVDMIGYKMFGLPIQSRPTISIARPRNLNSTHTGNSPVYGYLFFPLQVSNDSQILINSNGSLIEHLAAAHGESQKMGLPLVIKPHPAERDHETMERTIAFCQNNGIIVSQENTFALIKKSKLVITINSTCGLEATLIGKRVKYLGRSIFKDMTSRHIAHYIHGYLVDIDYFGRRPVSIAIAKDIMGRARPPAECKKRSS